MAKKFLISDLHLNHEPILRYESKTRGKMFNTIKEHDDFLIDNINSVVGKDDILIIAGDFCFGDKNIMTKYLNMINCERVELILGSHDRSESFMLSVGFSKVHRYPILINNLLISHEPIMIARHTSSMINVHGHIHSKQFNFGKIKYDESPDNFHWNLCPESPDMNYKPINIDELFDYAFVIL